MNSNRVHGFRLDRIEFGCINGRNSEIHSVGHLPSTQFVVGEAGQVIATVPMFHVHIDGTRDLNRDRISGSRLDCETALDFTKLRASHHYKFEFAVGRVYLEFLLSQPLVACEKNFPWPR